jgi:hypothetical protein
MNDLEKTQPQLEQEDSKETLREEPVAFQVHFVTFDEELLEEIMGSGGCCSRPRLPSLPPSPVRSERDLYPPHEINNPNFGLRSSPPRLADVMTTSVARPASVAGRIVRTVGR